MKPLDPPPFEILPRNLAEGVVEALRDERVVVINGARQAGKTTLARQIAGERGGTLLSLDIEELISEAANDPAFFIANSGPEPVVIDEFQRAPNLLLAIKAEVDRDPRPGRFLLTGSTRFLTVPTLSESLTGRVAILDLWPFSQGELLRLKESFVDRVFEDPRQVLRGPKGEALDRSSYFKRICKGGFPAIQHRTAGRGRERWFDTYVSTSTERDVREFGRIRSGADLSRLLELVAARTSGVLNESDLARDSRLSLPTLRSYLRILQTIFVVHTVPAWSTNLTSRMVRHPKIYLSDTGLAAHLAGADSVLAARPGSPVAGPLLETFVVNELRKQIGWAQRSARIFHFRDHNGSEVDIVLETRDATVVGIEVKAGTRIDSRDLRGLRLLRDRLGPRFSHGFVLYTGAVPQPIEESISVLPVSYLWT